MDGQKLNFSWAFVIYILGSKHSFQQKNYGKPFANK